MSDNEEKVGLPFKSTNMTQIGDGLYRIEGRLYSLFLSVYLIGIFAIFTFVFFSLSEIPLIPGFLSDVIYFQMELFLIVLVAFAVMAGLGIFNIWNTLNGYIKNILPIRMKTKLESFLILSDDIHLELLKALGTIIDIKLNLGDNNNKSKKEKKNSENYLLASDLIKINVLGNKNTHTFDLFYSTKFKTKASFKNSLYMKKRTLIRKLTSPNLESKIFLILVSALILLDFENILNSENILNHVTFYIISSIFFALIIKLSFIYFGYKIKENTLVLARIFKRKLNKQIIREFRNDVEDVLTYSKEKPLLLIILTNESITPELLSYVQSFNGKIFRKYPITLINYGSNNFNIIWTDSPAGD